MESARGKAKGRNCSILYTLCRNCSILCLLGRFLVGSGAKEGSLGKLGSCPRKVQGGRPRVGSASMLYLFGRFLEGWGQGRRFGETWLLSFPKRPALCPERLKERPKEQNISCFLAKCQSFWSCVVVFSYCCCGCVVLLADIENLHDPPYQPLEFSFSLSMLFSIWFPLPQSTTLYTWNTLGQCPLQYYPGNMELIGP